MTVVRTTVLKRADPPPFPDRWPRGVEHMADTPLDVVLLDGGMRSGLPSVMLCADLPDDGRGVVIETSWAAFHAAHAALEVAVIGLGEHAPGVEPSP